MRPPVHTTIKKMRTPYNRRRATLDPTDIDNSNQQPTPTFSLSKALLIFCAGVIVASSAMGLYLLNSKQKTKPVLKFVDEETVGLVEQAQAVNTSGGLPSRIFVVHDIDIQIDKERIISYDITTDTVQVLYSTEYDGEKMSLANPKVSPDGETILFCKATESGDSSIWSMDHDGQNPKLIIENVGYCDFSIKKSLEYVETVLIYVGDDDHIYSVDYSEENSIPVNLTVNINIPNHDYFHSPVLQDDRLFYVDSDSKVYTINLGRDSDKSVYNGGLFSRIDPSVTEKPSRMLVSDKISSAADTILNISPDGTK